MKRLTLLFLSFFVFSFFPVVSAHADGPPHCTSNGEGWHCDSADGTGIGGGHHGGHTPAPFYWHTEVAPPRTGGGPPDGIGCGGIDPVSGRSVGIWMNKWLVDRATGAQVPGSNDSYCAVLDAEGNPPPLPDPPSVEDVLALASFPSPSPTASPSQGLTGLGTTFSLQVPNYDLPTRLFDGWDVSLTFEIENVSWKIDGADAGISSVDGSRTATEFIVPTHKGTDNVVPTVHLKATFTLSLPGVPASATTQLFIVDVDGVPLVYPVQEVRSVNQTPSS